jgi:hypothetical protein
MHLRTASCPAFSTFLNMPCPVWMDGNGNFAAGTITASLKGGSTEFTGEVDGDISGTMKALKVNTVSGIKASKVAACTYKVANATNKPMPKFLAAYGVDGSLTATMLGSLTEEKLNFKISAIANRLETLNNSVTSTIQSEIQQALSKWSHSNVHTSAMSNNREYHPSDKLSVRTLQYDHVTTDTFNTTLESYTTNEYLNTTLQDYVTNINLTTTLQPYVTTDAAASTIQSQLQAAIPNINLAQQLEPYVTSENLTTTLSNYVTSSSLTTTLSNYVTSSSLTTTLENYATTSSLSNYVTSASLTTTLLNYVTSASLTSTLSSYATNAAVFTDIVNELTTNMSGDVVFSGTANSLTNTIRATSAGTGNRVSSDAIFTAINDYVTSLKYTSSQIAGTAGTYGISGVNSFTTWLQYNLLQNTSLMGENTSLSQWVISQLTGTNGFLNVNTANGILNPSTPATTGNPILYTAASGGTFASATATSGLSTNLLYGTIPTSSLIGAISTASLSGDLAASNTNLTLDVNILLKNNGTFFSASQTLQSYVQTLGQLIVNGVGTSATGTFIHIGNGYAADNSLAIGQGTASYSGASLSITSALLNAIAIGGASDVAAGASAGALHDIVLGSGATSSSSGAGNAIVIGSARTGQLGPTVNGIGSIAIGSSSDLSPGANVQATYAIALGAGSSIASLCTTSIAIGNNSKVTSANSCAIGPSTVASGTTSCAVGPSAIASGATSCAFGTSAVASGSNACAVGYGASVSANNAIQLGNSSMQAIKSYAPLVSQQQVTTFSANLTINGSMSDGTMIIKGTGLYTSGTAIGTFTIFVPSGFTAVITVSPSSASAAACPICATISNSTVTVYATGTYFGATATWYYHIGYYSSAF